MKLQYVLLLLGVLIASVAAQTCTNNRTAAQCRNQINTRGCQNISVRINCRLACNVCDSYEIPNPTSLVNNAVMYGGGHVMTWDRLQFDATVRGELTLVTNTRTGLKVHALTSRQSGTRTPVITAMTAVSTFGAQRLQVAVDPTRSGSARSVGQCRLLYWIGNRRLTDAQVNQLAGFGGIAKIPDSFEPFAYKMDLRSGARVVISLQYTARRGCYFDRVVVRMRDGLKLGTRGLLGTPDNNIYNDWHRRNGNVINIPNRNGRYFLNAYNYGRNNWCIRNVGGSIIKYNFLGNFATNQRCGVPYDGFINFSSATPEMRRVCGAFNFECLHDSVSTGVAAEGLRTNVLMLEAESFTVPEEGLRVDPRGIRAGRASTVKVSVKLDRFVSGLNGFAVFLLNEATLRRTGGPLFTLLDDGNSATGDDDIDDGEYTSLASLTLANGISVSYAAIPIINDSTRFDRQDLTFTLPISVRGYSQASGRITQVDENRRFELETIRATSIEVNYIWPESEADLDSGTSFLGGSVGFGCPGGDYVREVTGDSTSIGGLETSSVFIGRAFLDGEFTASATISLYAHWFIGARGSGPIVISVTAKRFGDDRPISSASMTISVTPGRGGGCAASVPSSRVARVNVRRNISGRFVFTLISG